MKGKYDTLRDTNSITWHRDEELDCVPVAVEGELRLRHVAVRHEALGHHALRRAVLVHLHRLAEDSMSEIRFGILWREIQTYLEWSPARASSMAAFCLESAVWGWLSGTCRQFLILDNITAGLNGFYFRNRSVCFLFDINTSHTVLYIQNTLISGVKSSWTSP